TATGSAIHLTRHATISPAVAKVQKPIGPGFLSIKVAISSPTNAPNIATPAARAIPARPNDGSSCSALASGGPTARAPHGQPRQRSSWAQQPQAGQIIKNVLTSGENKKRD